MAIPLEDQQRQAEFAEKARLELVEHWQNWKAEDVARWLHKWVQFGKATYDPLCRDLIKVTGVKPDDGIVEYDDD